STTGFPAQSDRLTVLSSSVCRVKSATFWFTSMGVPRIVSMLSKTAKASVDYFRGVGTVSSRSFHSGSIWATVLAVSVGLAPAVLAAQYPGQITKKSKDTPELRAVAVLEWTGEEGK